MELNQSNAILVKEKINDNPEEWKYMIYSVTLMDHSQYVAEEYNQTTYTQNTHGDYEVTLEVSQDTSIPVDMQYLKPVVHIADLTGIPLSETNPTVELSVKKGSQLMGKKRKLHKSVADENARPV